MLYKDAGHIVEYVAQAVKQASRGASLLYAPVLDRHLEARADRPGLLLLLNMQGQAYSQRRGIPEEMASQTTWEAFSLDGPHGVGGPAHKGLP